MRCQLSERFIDCVSQLLAFVARHRRIDLRQLRPLFPRASAFRVDGRDHAPQPVGGVRGSEVEARRVARLEELLERAVEGVDREPRRACLVEHLVVRVDAGREGVTAQELRAQAVDRRDPGGVRLARRLWTPELEEPPPDARAQLGGGLLGERDREDSLDAHPVLDYGAYVPLDQHPCLAAARVRVHEQSRVPALDRGALLGCQLEGHSSCLQIEG
jgi:hypothetical protein